MVVGGFIAAFNSNKKLLKLFRKKSFNFLAKGGVFQIVVCLFSTQQLFTKEKQIYK